MVTHGRQRPRQSRPARAWFRRRLAVVFAIGCIIQPAPLPAQDGSSASAAPSRPDWIRPEEVPARAEALRRRLERGRPDADRESSLAEIERSLPPLVGQVDAVIQRAKDAAGRGSSAAELEDLGHELADIAAPLADWNEWLQHESERIGRTLDEVERGEDLWSRTAARPETVAAGDVVERRVKAAIGALREAAVELHRWRARLIMASDHVLDRSAAVDGAIKRLQAAATRANENILVPGQAPYWSRGFAANLRQELPHVAETLRVYSASTAAYIRRDPRSFVLQMLMAALLMLVLGRFSARARESLGGNGTAVRVLERPYSVGLLLAVVAAPFFHPLAPRRLMQLLAIFGLFPAARLVTHASSRATPAFFLGLFAVLLFDRVGMALQPLPALQSITFLLTLSSGVAVLWRLAQRNSDVPWLARAAKLSMALLALSLAAEVGGWSYLASLLGRGILAGVVAGVYVYAATVALAALVACVLASNALRRSHLLVRNTASMQQGVEKALPWIGVPLWFYFVANALGLRDNLANLLSTLLGSGVSVGALSLSLGGVLAFVLTLVAALVLARLVTGVLEEDIYPRTSLPRGIPYVLSTLARYGVYSLGFLFALAAAGVQLSQLSIILGGLGVGIGLGLQDLVKNFAAGLTLLFERRVHVGDALELPGQGIAGRVRSIDMRASVVRTWNGAEVVVPNADLIAGAVTNYTLSDQLYRLEIPVGVAYGSDLEQVAAVLLDAVRSNDQLLTTPAPQALFTGFGDSSLNFLVRAWTEGYERALPLTSELGLAIHRKLREAAIEIPFPQRDLHLASVSPAAREALAREE